MNSAHLQHAAPTTRQLGTEHGHPISRSPALATDRTSMPRLQSNDLLGAHQEIEIEHGTAVYRLRRTSLGKLILTK